MRLIRIFSRFKLDLLIVSLISFGLPLFLYKLGQSSLVSWDEAWYADISRNIARTGNLFNLVYNFAPYSDHPPAGFWFTAILFKLFGVSDFNARLGSAISGYLALITIYLLGKKLFNRVVGLASATALLSSYWFLFRARSGNLDAILTLFFILTIYLAILAKEKRNFFIPFILSFIFLTLIKSFLGFLVVPSLLIIFWRNNNYKIKDWLIVSCAVISMYGGWLLVQALTDPQLVFWHILHTTREASVGNDFYNSFSLAKEYIHSGIGKWFWPGLLGICTVIIFRQKRFLILTIFFLSYILPFLTSQRVQIWHLIPLYPVMILSFFGSFYVCGKFILKKFNFKENIFEILLALSILLFSGFYSFIQLRSAWYQFIDIPAYVSDEAILSREAGKYEDPIYIDGDFDPAGTFYADKKVTKLYAQSLKEFFEENNNFLLITNDWRIKEAKIEFSKYKTLKKDRDKVLVRKVNLDINKERR